MVRRAIVTAIAPWMSGKATKVDLQRIAGLIGVPVTGTKSELSAAIQHAVKLAEKDLNPDQSKPRGIFGGTSHSIVSIDMGIRNLAFAHLTTQLYKSSGESTILTKPTLQTWRRLSVGRESLHATPEAVSTMSTDISEDEDAETGQQTQESFEPVDLAVHACACAKYIVQLQPSHVLIERQRFRSGGHAVVQEWSLRVGVFEGMLYACLRTLAEEGRFHGQVEPMLPARVNRFWLQDSTASQNGSQKVLQEDTASTARITGREAKQAKIGLVAEMLDGAESAQADFDLAQDAEETALFFMESYQGTYRSKRQHDKSKRTFKKLDDLSDSLLQGLAWIEWHNNRLALQQQLAT